MSSKIFWITFFNSFKAASISTQNWLYNSRLIFISYALRLIKELDMAFLFGSSSSFCSCFRFSFSLISLCALFSASTCLCFSLQSTNAFYVSTSTCLFFFPLRTTNAMLFHTVIMFITTLIFFTPQLHPLFIQNNLMWATKFVFVFW